MTARMSGVWPPLVRSFTSAPSASKADTAFSSPDVTALVNGMEELIARYLQKHSIPQRGLVRYFTGLTGFHPVRSKNAINPVSVRRRHKRLIDAKPVRELRIRRTYAGADPLVDGANQSQDLWP